MRKLIFRAICATLWGAGSIAPKPLGRKLRMAVIALKIEDARGFVEKNWMKM